MTKPSGRALFERFITPKQLADRGILSLVTQWKERAKGRLKHYRIGTKILYDESHITEYLSMCETPAREKKAKRKTHIK